MFGGPHNKDHNALGSILGSPIQGSYHVRVSDTWGDATFNNGDSHGKENDMKKLG